MLDPYGQYIKSKKQAAPPVPLGNKLMQMYAAADKRVQQHTNGPQWTPQHALNEAGNLVLGVPFTTAASTAKNNTLLVLGKGKFAAQQKADAARYKRLKAHGATESQLLKAAGTPSVGQFPMFGMGKAKPLEELVKDVIRPHETTPFIAGAFATDVKSAGYKASNKLRTMHDAQVQAVKDAAINPSRRNYATQARRINTKFKAMQNVDPTNFSLPPWEMKWEEMVMHPNSVFHATRSRPGLGQLRSGIHAGTLQAASDRTYKFGGSINNGFTRQIHPIWMLAKHKNLASDKPERAVYDALHSEGNRVFPFRDAEANDIGAYYDQLFSKYFADSRKRPSTLYREAPASIRDFFDNLDPFVHSLIDRGVSPYDPGFTRSLAKNKVYPYANYAEDKGSISYVGHDPQVMKTHESMILQAAKEGKDVRRALESYPVLKRNLEQFINTPTSVPIRNKYDYAKLPKFRNRIDEYNFRANQIDRAYEAAQTRAKRLETEAQTIHEHGGAAQDLFNIDPETWNSYTHKEKAYYAEQAANHVKLNPTPAQPHSEITTWPFNLLTQKHAKRVLAQLEDEIELSKPTHFMYHRDEVAENLHLFHTTPMEKSPSGAVGHKSLGHNARRYMGFTTHDWNALSPTDKLKMMHMYLSDMLKFHS